MLMSAMIRSGRYTFAHSPFGQAVPGMNIQSGQIFVRNAEFNYRFNDRRLKSVFNSGKSPEEWVTMVLAIRYGL